MPDAYATLERQGNAFTVRLPDGTAWHQSVGISAQAPAWERALLALCQEVGRQQGLVAGLAARCHGQSEHLTQLAERDAHALVRLGEWLAEGDYRRCHFRGTVVEITDCCRSVFALARPADLDIPIGNRPWVVVVGTNEHPAGLGPCILAALERWATLDRQTSEATPATTVAAEGCPSHEEV